MQTPSYAAKIVLRHIQRFGPNSLNEFAALTINGVCIDADTEVHELFMLGYVSKHTQYGEHNIVSYGITDAGEEYLSTHNVWLPDTEELNPNVPITEEQKNDAARYLFGWVTAPVNKFGVDGILERGYADVNANDCVLLWSLGIQVDDDMRGAL